MLFKCLLALLLVNLHLTLSGDNSKDNNYRKKKRNPQHKRPENGTGTILISYNNTSRHRNEKRILVVFDLMCVNGLNQSDSRLMSKIDHIRQRYINCLDLFNLSKAHFDTANYSYVWMDLRCKMDIIQQKKNITLDYDDLCIEYIMYEPIFWPNQTTPSTSNTTAPAHECNSITTDRSKSWGLDLLDSPAMDVSYSLVDVNTVRDNPNGLDLFVIDSGVQAEHIEFNSGQVIHEMGDGPTTTTNKLGETVYDVHGTHVSGSIGGKNYGSSHGLRIYDYRVCEFDEKGEVPCYTSLITDALERVVSKLKSNPSRRGVINLSLGGEKTTAMNDIYQSYFDKILNAGGIPIVAAGNENIDACDVSPAYSSNAITVGAFDSSREKSWFSNWGNCVDIWGPGEQIWSSIPSSTNDKYTFLSGTSMASPMIAGVVANILAVSPTLNKAQIMEVLLNDSVSVTYDKCDEYRCEAPLYFCGKKVSDGDWEYSDPLGTLEIILIVIGCVFGVVVIAMCVLYILKHNKKVSHTRVPDKDNPNVNQEGNVEEQQAIIPTTEGEQYDGIYT